MLVEPPVVEPIDPPGGGDLDLVHGLPWLARLDQLRLVKPVDRLGQRVAARVAGAADRVGDTGLGERLAMTDRGPLGALVVAVDQPGEVAVPVSSPDPDCLLEVVENEVALPLAMCPDQGLLSSGRQRCQAKTISLLNSLALERSTVKTSYIHAASSP